MATQPTHFFTFEEYLEHELKAEYKSEFQCGEIFAMSGGTEPHSRMSARMVALLDQRLDCRVYDSNLKLRIEEFDKGVYPDCMAVCGRPEFWGGREDVILNPTVVVEVLSRTAGPYGKGEKSTYYRSIPSLQRCLLISPRQIFIEHSARQVDGSWSIIQITDRKATLLLLGEIEIRVDEIYRDIVLS